MSLLPESLIHGYPVLNSLPGPEFLNTHSYWIPFLREFTSICKLEFICMIILLKSDPLCWQWSRQNGNLINCMWEYKMLQLLWRSLIGAQSFNKNLNIIQLPWALVFPKENESIGPCKELYTHSHDRFIYNISNQN